MARTEAQRAVARTNGARSRGPISDEGKKRSSLNSIRHGIFARRTLFPGEDRGEHEALTADYIECFNPKNSAEANVVAEIADLVWRLRRLQMIENGLMMRRLQEHLEETQLFRVRYKTGNCLTAVRATAAVVEEVAPKDSIAGMAIFLDGLGQLIAMLNDLEDLAPCHVATLEAALAAWTNDGNGSTLREVGYRALSPVLRRIEEALVDKRVSEDEQLEAAKRHIAESDLLLNGDDVKLLDKYRRGLEAATSRQLEVLASVRASSVEIKMDNDNSKLRIVK